MRPDAAPGGESSWGVKRGAKDDPALLEGLRAAVPWWIAIYRRRCPIEAGRRARACAAYVGTHGDAVQYRSSRPGGAAEAFNRLAEGIAIAASQPGGITVFGLHFAAPPLPEPGPGCTIHWCPGGVCRTSRSGAG